MRVISVHQQLKMGIKQRLISGEFSVGERLPGIRQLADELGVNKNTVLRVYKELESEGLLQLHQGLGAYVQRTPGVGEADSVALGDLLTWPMWLARVWGIDEGKLRLLIDECLVKVYRQTVRVAFVECHPHDAKVMASLVEARIGVHVDPVVLDDFVSNSEQYFSAYDLLVTTFFHYGDLKEAAGTRWGSRIVGVDHTVRIDNLRTLSSIPRGSKVGLVCKNERTLARLQKLVEVYCQEPVHACLISDEQTVRDMLNACDYVIDHPQVIEDLVGTSELYRKVISLDFEVKEESIESLRKRVVELAVAGSVSPYLPH